MLNIRLQAGSPEETDNRLQQVDELLAFWSGLDSTGLTVEGLQPLLAGNGRFVVSLAKQYQNQGVSQEALLRVAHEAMIKLLNQYAGRPEKLDKVLAPALRDSMIAAIQG